MNANMALLETALNTLASQTDALRAKMTAIDQGTGVYAGLCDGLCTYSNSQALIDLAAVQAYLNGVLAVITADIKAALAQVSSTYPPLDQTTFSALPGVEIQADILRVYAGYLDVTGGNLYLWQNGILQNIGPFAGLSTFQWNTIVPLPDLFPGVEPYFFASVDANNVLTNLGYFMDEDQWDIYPLLSPTLIGAGTTGIINTYVRLLPGSKVPATRRFDIDAVDFGITSARLAGANFLMLCVKK